MKKVLLVALSSFLLATGCVSERGIDPLDPDVVDPHGPEDPVPASPELRLGPPGPVVAEYVGDIRGFSMNTLGTDVDSPVVAVGPDGRVFYAYLTGDFSWPVVGWVGGPEPVKLPGDDTTTAAVAMLASADGSVHLAWDADRRIRHVQFWPDGTFSAATQLGEGPAREPNLAITSAGGIVVAWTRDTPDVAGERQSPRVLVSVGTGSPPSFDAPRIVNAECCFNEIVGQVAERMSGPSLALGPDDEIHVVYEWSSFANTTIEYVKEEAGGTFTAPLQVSDAAFIPCPAVGVDARGVAHITYLRELEPNVLYRTVEDGVASEETSVYAPESGRASMSMMVLGADGVMHLGVTEQVPGGRLQYLRIEEPGVEPEMTTLVDMEESGSRVELTPRTGGIVTAPDGKLLFSFLRMPGGEASTTAEFAMGR